MQTCGVYATESDLFVVSMAKTVPGFELDVEPMFKTSRKDQAAAIGQLVVAALDSYREGVPAPDPRGKVPSPLLQFAGFRSWKALEKAALNVLISRNGARVTVVPTARQPRGGYAHKPDLAISATAEPGAIGQAVEKALSLSA